MLKRIDETIIGLIFLVILGLFLRWYNITFQSYWLDELVSAHLSNPSNTLSNVYTETLKGAPPLYQILLWCWYNVFGYNEIAGRLLSLTLGTLSIIGIFYLGKELFNKQVGLYSALLLSFNQFAIYYSQEVRAYALLMLGSVFATYFLIRLIRTSENIHLILYSLAIGSTFYSHYFGFFILVSHLFFLLIFKRKWISENRRSLLFSGLFLFLIFLPLAQNILELSELQEYWVEKPNWYFWGVYFHAYFQSKILTIFFGLLILYALYKTIFKYNASFNENVWLLILTIFLTYTLSYLRSIFSTPLLTVRNTIVILPFIIVLISIGISKVRSAKMKIGIVISITLLSGHQLVESSYYSNIKKQNWKAVLLEVKKENKSELPVYDIVYNGYYYDTYAQLLKLDMKINDKEELKKDLRNSKLEDHFWLLDAHGDNFAQLNKFCNENYTVQKELNYKNAKAILLRKD